MANLVPLQALPVFWAKLSREPGTPTFHPLVCHLLDVAATAEAMWDGVLPAAVTADFANALCLPMSAARSWATFLAGAHDLGKLSPAFQLRPEAESLAGAYRDWGGTPGTIGAAPHGMVSALALRRLLTGARFGCSSRVASELAALVGGHHGTFPTPAVLHGLHSRLAGEGPWAEARETVLHALADVVGLPPVAPDETRLAHAACLAGLVSVADWIASDERWFPHVASTSTPAAPGDLAAYLAQARSQARAALHYLGWLSWQGPSTVATFQQLFPYIAAPRPLQTVAIAEAQSHSDDATLFVIEAPTGEGKTEAALYLAQALAAAGGRCGMYVALPTQATSNQMFGRVAAFLTRGGGGDRAELQLLHGHAALSAEFELVRKGSWAVSRPAGIEVDGSTMATITANAWFSHRKRGLLAPFGVGTVDQVLLAALRRERQRERTLRLTDAPDARPGHEYHSRRRAHARRHRVPRGLDR